MNKEQRERIRQMAASQIRPESYVHHLRERRARAIEGAVHLLEAGDYEGLRRRGRQAMFWAWEYAGGPAIEWEFSSTYCNGRANSIREQINRIKRGAGQTAMDWITDPANFALTRARLVSRGHYVFPAVQKDGTVASVIRTWRNGRSCFEQRFDLPLDDGQGIGNNDRFVLELKKED